jgi:hypothetical protein
VQAIVNVVTLFSLHGCLQDGLFGFLHPLPLGEKLVAAFFHRRILEHYRVFHRPVSIHRSESDAVLVHVNANDRFCISLTGDSMGFVRDRDVETPLVVFVDDFSGTNPPFVVGECGLESIEMVGAATKFAFHMRASCGSETEPNRPIVFREQAVTFLVVHHHRVHSVDVWVWSPPPIVFVVVVCLDFTECFVDDELARVFDVISVINNG